MLENQDKITIKELKTYLYSLEDEQAKAKEKKIQLYKTKCEATKKKVKEKEIQKIEKQVNKEYESRMEAKDEILELLEECSSVPSKMEKLEVARYMVYRVDAKSAENTLLKATKRIGKRYNAIVEAIEDNLVEFPSLDDVEEIDFSIYKASGEPLKKAKEKYKESYTDEERMALIQKELDIIAKAKIFNTTPIPHEILKNSDRDIQSKMQKFNSVRQKRIRILSTMEADYLKLQTPREINTMIDDAILNIEEINEILTKSEYNKVKNSLIRKRKKIYKSTSELRSIIKSKEKKTGIINYNIQEARYGRMETLRNIITEANNIIKANVIPGAEEQLEKLISSYEREKQFAIVIEKLQEDKGEIADQNVELKAFEEQISSLEYRINNSRKITKEQEEKIAKAKKELLILWKMEIDTTISKRKETLEIPESTEDNKIEKDSIQKSTKSIFSKMKKAQSGKHACV